MTQPNQSELDSQSTRSRVDKNELDECTDDLDFDWQRYIAANYTPNSEVAEREQVARIDEIKRTRPYLTYPGMSIDRKVAL